MTDMLVKLYDLPDLAPALDRCHAAGVDIRRAYATEQHHIFPWMREHFSEGWVSEITASLARMPVAAFIAVEQGAMVGFACYDSLARGVFGPTGVSEAVRGKGVGAGLLLACLHDMRAQGYAYAVIGWAGPLDFYAKVSGATVIPDSRPGMYRGMLGVQQEE